MAFIISKKSTRNGQLRQLYYLVENYRDKASNRIKRKTLLKLNESKTLNELLTISEQEEAEILNRLNLREKELNDLVKTRKRPPFSFGSPYYIIRKRLDWSIEQAKANLEVCRSKITQIKGFI